MLVTRGGRRFVATQEGLYERTPSGDRKHVLIASDPDLAVWWIGETDDGTLYAGTKRNGMFTLRRGSPGWVRDRRIESNFPTRFVGDVHGSTYVLGSGIALRLEPDQAVKLAALQSNYAFGSSDGQTWMASDLGLHRIEGDEVSGPLIEGTAWSIAEAPDGALWVATVGQGLCRLDPSALNKNPPLRPDETRCLTSPTGYSPTPSTACARSATSCGPRRRAG